LARSGLGRSGGPEDEGQVAAQRPKDYAVWCPLHCKNSFVIEGCRRSITATIVCEQAVVSEEDGCTDAHGCIRHGSRPPRLPQRVAQRSRANPRRQGRRHRAIRDRRRSPQLHRGGAAPPSRGRRRIGMAKAARASTCRCRGDNADGRCASWDRGRRRKGAGHRGVMGDIGRPPPGPRNSSMPSRNSRP
jgi:hypothetical protein